MPVMEAEPRHDDVRILPINEPRFYAPEEIAEMLQIPLRTIQRLLRSGHLQSVRVGFRYRVSNLQLEQFLRESMICPPNLDEQAVTETPSQEHEERSPLRRNVGSAVASDDPFRVSLTPDQRAQLEYLLKKRVLSPRLLKRVQIVQMSDEGQTHAQIAIQMGVSKERVRHWINAFLSYGFDGLEDQARSYLRYSELTDEQREKVRQVVAGTDPMPIPELVQLIERNCGFRVHAGSLRRFLREASGTCRLMPEREGGDGADQDGDEDEEL